MFGRKRNWAPSPYHHYLLLESGPADGRVARVYPDDGHIAARSERFWGPASWAWLRGVLTKGMKPKAAAKKPAKKKAAAKKSAKKKVVKKK